MAREIAQFVSNQKLQPDNMAEEAMNKEAYHDERTAEIAPRLWEAGANKLAGALNEQQAQSQTAGVMADMASLTVQAHKDLDTTLNTADPSSTVDPMDKYGEDLQTKIAAVGDKYDNPRAKEVFTRMSSDLQTNLLDRGYSQWQQQTREYTAGSLKDTANKFSIAAISDPASVDNIAQQFSSAAQAAQQAHPGMLSVDEMKGYTTDGLHGIYNNAAMSLVHQVESNPTVSLAAIGKVREILGGDNFKSNMSAADYLKVQDDLDKAVKTREDAVSLYAEKSMPALLKQVDQFGDPDQSVGRTIAALPANTPEQAARKQELMDNYGASIATSQATKFMENLPENQVNDFVNQRKADYQNAKTPDQVKSTGAAYDAAVKAAKQRDDEFFKDPSAYILQHNDTVGALYVNYQKSPTPQNFQMYALASAGQQNKLYPDQPPRVLTDDMKQDIKGQMMQVEQTPSGGLAAATILTKLRDTTGQFYNEAVHELYKDHIVNPAQFAAAQLLGSPSSWSLAQEGMRAASIPGDDLTKTSGVSVEAAQKVATKALQPLMSTFADTTNGHELVAGYVDFISNIMRARGKVDADTASALAQTAVLDRFTIKNNLRIPNGFDADDVSDGAANIQANIGKHDLVAPPSFSGSGPALQGAEYADDIKDFGHWSTNARGDGMLLYDQYGAPVYEKVKGHVSQVEIPWQSAADVGKGIRSPLNNAKRFFANPGSLEGTPWAPSKQSKEDTALQQTEQAANPNGK